jgi:hypothetical protein
MAEPDGSAIFFIQILFVETHTQTYTTMSKLIAESSKLKADLQIDLS